jgi:polyisoprenoid-binding protein YceI
MKRLSLFAIFLFFLFSNAASLSAAVRTWEIDTAHSNFYFTVDHVYSKVRGQFNEFSGEVKFDPGNLADSRFFFKIRIDSIDTNIAKRDKHLLSADFFDAGKYPVMTFESVKITDAGNNVYEVAGKFTIKGEVYDLILPLAFAGVKAHPAVEGKEVAGFNGTVVIDRLAHKVGDGKFYKMGLVGKDVDVLVTLEVLSDK